MRLNGETMLPDLSAANLSVDLGCFLSLFLLRKKEMRYSERQNVN